MARTVVSSQDSFLARIRMQSLPAWAFDCCSDAPGATWSQACWGGPCMLNQYHVHKMVHYNYTHSHVYIQLNMFFIRVYLPFPSNSSAPEQLTSCVFGFVR